MQRLTDNLQAQGLEKVHVVQQDGKPFLCLHYDPTRTAMPQARSMTEAAGAELSERYPHELMHIDGMGCSTCATNIEHASGRLNGVLEASVSYAAERMRREYDTGKVSRNAVVQRLEALDYGVLEPHHEAPWHVEQREPIVSVVAGALLLAGDRARHARATRGGVWIKGGVHLENLRWLSVIAFDKTGTITTGKPVVADVVVLSGDEASLLDRSAGGSRAGSAARIAGQDHHAGSRADSCGLSVAFR